MGKFLAVHTLPSPTTAERATPMGKAVKANSGADAYWVGSWLQMNEQGEVTKILCDWDAKDAESVRKILAKIRGLPVDGVYPMGKVDAEAYR
jgi:hypothetical protein